MSRNQSEDDIFTIYQKEQQKEKEQLMKVIRSKECQICINKKNPIEILQNKMKTQYFESFNFYFSKPINEILANVIVPHVVSFKDYLYFDDDNEYLKRYYPTEDIPQRLDILTEYYNSEDNNQNIFYNNRPYCPILHKVEQRKALEKNVRKKYKMQQLKENEMQKYQNQDNQQSQQQDESPNTNQSIVSQGKQNNTDEKNKIKQENKQNPFRSDNFSLVSYIREEDNTNRNQNKDNQGNFGDKIAQQLQINQQKGLENNYQQEEELLKQSQYQVSESENIQEQYFEVPVRLQISYEQQVR